MAWVTPNIFLTSFRSPWSLRCSTDIPHLSPLHEFHSTGANDDSLENWASFHHCLYRRLVVSSTANAEYSVRKMVDKNDFDNRWDRLKIQFTRSLRRWPSNVFVLELLAKGNLIIRVESEPNRRFSRLETRSGETISFSVILWPYFDGSTVVDIWKRDRRGRLQWRQFIPDERRTNNIGRIEWNVAFSAQRSSSTYLDENQISSFSPVFVCCGRSLFLFSVKWIKFQLKSIETLRSKMTIVFSIVRLLMLHHSVRCHGTSDGWDDNSPSHWPMNRTSSLPINRDSVTMHCGIPHPITFANRTSIGFISYTLFITTQNTIVVQRYDNGQIVIWQNNATDNPTKPIPAGLSEGWRVFLASGEQICVDQGTRNGQVERWTMNGTRISSTFFLCSDGDGLFVDVDEHLYCSTNDRHQVMRQSLTDPSSELISVGGINCQSIDSWDVGFSCWNLCDARSDAIGVVTGTVPDKENHLPRSSLKINNQVFRRSDCALSDEIVKVTLIQKKISQFNAKRNVSEGESELKSDTAIIGEKQRTLDQIEMIDWTNVKGCKWIVGDKVKPCDKQSNLPTLRLRIGRWSWYSTVYLKYCHSRWNLGPRLEKETLTIDRILKWSDHR